MQLGRGLFACKRIELRKATMRCRSLVWLIAQPNLYLRGEGLTHRAIFVSGVHSTPGNLGQDGALNACEPFLESNLEVLVEEHKSFDMFI